MMNEEKIEQMYRKAERIVAKCQISEPRVGFQEVNAHSELFPRNLVSVMTEGQLRGQLFGAWMPITEEAYRDDGFRSGLTSLAHSVWRRQAVSVLVPMPLLLGPKGKLPA